MRACKKYVWETKGRNTFFCPYSLITLVHIDIVAQLTHTIGAWYPEDTDLYHPYQRNGYGSRPGFMKNLNVKPSETIFRLFVRPATSFAVFSRSL